MPKNLMAYLRRTAAKRMPRGRGVARMGQKTEMLSIYTRQPEVDDQALHSQWERVLIQGEGDRSRLSALVMLLSYLVTQLELADATSASALWAFTFKRQNIAKPMRQVLTCDQGIESWRAMSNLRAVPACWCASGNRTGDGSVVYAGAQTC